jgi:O-antigen ligase
MDDKSMRAGRPVTGNGGLMLLLTITIGALASVLLVLPYRSFDLDRFFAPKELALHIAALVSGLLALAGADRLRLSRADIALGAWIAVSIVSGVFATNHWLAFRAVSITISGAVIFWSARKVAGAGLGSALAGGLAATVVIGALTALAQAYGVKMEFATLSRAPGGTFGNRNFMAHLAAAGVPLLLWCAVAARSRLASILGTLGLLVCAAALVLSRTRAAWLALIVWGIVTLFAVLTGPPLFDSATTRRRAWLAIGGVIVGVALALLVPNALDWKSENPYLDSVKDVVNYREGSGQGRLKQYKNSVQLALHSPVLGVGPGNWPVKYPKVAPPDDPSLVEGTGMTANPWPSSDWFAALSERGPIGVLCFGAFALLLAVGALQLRLDPARSAPDRLAALAGVSVLAITLLEGTFDAVLLLSTPAIVVWAAVGALIPLGPIVRTIELGGSRKIAVFALLIGATAGATVMSSLKIQAMAAYTNGSIDRAVSLDPGSFRIRMRAAEGYLGKGQCKAARVQALAAHDLFPESPAPKRILSQCGGLPKK